MAKKNSDKKKKANKKAKEQSDERRSDKATSREDGPFNFGGIPERSLKKNLGC